MGSDRTPLAPELLREVAHAFVVPGRWIGSERYGSGHINDTVLAVFETDGRRLRWVQQRINAAVFPEPLRVMENVARVVAHQQAAAARSGPVDLERRVLDLAPSRSGGPAYVDTAGGTWRTWRFIEGARSHDVVQGPEQAAAAAEAFGRFVARLADLPAPRLHETIPRFADPRFRLEQLLAAVRSDPLGRLRESRAEVDFVLAREPLVARYQALRDAGALPERITHNDTKINNVLLDDASGEGLCVIDLDTVMPGTPLYDFGDLVRTASTRAAEDERDLARLRVEPLLFEALVEGYRRGIGDLLGPAERAELVFAARLVTLMIGMRFLADHLLGDVYFRTHRPDHNLDRARAQLALVADLERRSAELAELAERSGAAGQPPRRPADG
jgi:aminoglycoside phosphotransferase (APT) family kinase protein